MITREQHIEAAYKTGQAVGFELVARWLRDGDDPVALADALTLNAIALRESVASIVAEAAS
jgi:hypothetical protein